ncbi:probable ribose-5-phosphate isomerase 3, chloroplastic isoform X3 [Eucalyptus grandis]|nr:probable ribose-5-phosphate isomerase 3, chloroplastic isoform X3 [Eucalyptus grandis]
MDSSALLFNQLKVRLQELFNEEGCEAKLQLNEDGKPYMFIVDLYLKTPIKDGSTAGKEISLLEGVVEHGLFLDMATTMIMGNVERLSSSLPSSIHTLWIFHCLKLRELPQGGLPPSLERL